ncbi:AAA domain-containing protein, partial [Arthrospira platensis SPKY2]
GDVLAIVTPFAAQEAVIRHALLQHGLKDEKIVAGTVDKLQGSQRKIIVFSQTYATPGSMFLLNDKPNRLNVAVSRAEDHFILFGQTEMISTVSRTPYGMLAASILSNHDNEIT